MQYAGIMHNAASYQLYMHMCTCTLLCGKVYFHLYYIYIISYKLQVTQVANTNTGMPVSIATPAGPRAIALEISDRRVTSHESPPDVAHLDEAT